MIITVSILNVIIQQKRMDIWIVYVQHKCDESEFSLKSLSVLSICVESRLFSLVSVFNPVLHFT